MRWSPGSTEEDGPQRGCNRSGTLAQQTYKEVHVVARADIPRKGLTPKFIESLRPKEQAYELPDTAAPGLRLRIHPSGVKSFRWGVRSLRKVVTIGPWSMSEIQGHVTLAQARDWLGKLKAARVSGADQLAVTEAALRTHLAPRPTLALTESVGVTVAEVADRFLTVVEKQRKLGATEVRYILEKDVLPVIGAKPLSTLRKSDCREVVERVVKRGAPVHAGKVLGLVKQLLNYGENVEDDFLNPAARLKAANLGVESNVRDRWLSDTEIPLFWSALDPDKHGAPKRSVPETKTAVALRLLLLTGARSAELRRASWSEVDFAANTWTVPVAHQKLTPKQARTAKPFVIPLAPTALTLFQELKKETKDTPFVLASEDGHSGLYTEKSFGRAMRRMWRTHPLLKKLPEASPHDLRRTARTWLGKLGTPPHIAERCLNHRLGRIVATYDRGDYLAERRAALEKWDAFLAGLLAPGSVNITFLQVRGGV
ncbi:MAG: tyrosine-type recombinase/integrase [Myxococcaceae bacterium]